MNSKRFTSFSIVVGALVMVAQWAGAATPINERQSFSATGLVEVENISGRIEVTAWDKNEVELTGTLGEGVEQLYFKGDESHLTIAVKVPRNARNVEASVLNLMVPATASVEASGVSADVLVFGLQGERLQAESVSGDVTVEADVQVLDVNSVSGDVLVKGSARRADLETVSGDIIASGLSGDVTVASVSGQAEVTTGKLKRGRFETVSGDLIVDTDLAEDGSLVLEALSGDIELTLPKDISATCDAESFSGSIDSDRGETRKAKYGPNKELSFVAGSGSGRIQITNFSGDVEISSK